MTNSDDSEPTDASAGTKNVYQVTDGPSKKDNQSDNKTTHKRMTTRRQAEPLELSLKLKLNGREAARLSDVLVEYANHICTQMESDDAAAGAIKDIAAEEHEASLRRSSHRMWLRIRNGMQARHLRARHFMAFAYNLGSMTITGLQGESPYLARIGALRLASGAAQRPELVLTARFALLMTLGEYLTNSQMTKRQDNRIWKLYRVTLHDISTSADAIRDDIPSGFWTKSLYYWLLESITIQTHGLAPDDWLLQRTAEQLATFTNDRMAEKLAAGDRFERPKGDRTSELESVPPPENIDRHMRVLGSLDLAQYGEGKKLEYVRRFTALTGYLPLTMLPPIDELTKRLGDLKAEMPNFSSVVDFLVSGFSLQARSTKPPVLYLRPMLIVGPPAIGKTRFVKKLADLLGAGWSMMIPAGDSDNRNFVGTARGFNSGHPSWAVEQIQKLNCANPILVLDEIEKAGGSSSNGILEHSLLPFLEVESSVIYNDPFLGGPMDLSAISWILMANTITGLSEPLRSRLHVVNVRPPGLEMFGTILKNVLVEIAEHLSIDQKLLPDLPSEYVAWLRAEYSKAPDIRGLKARTEILLNAMVRLEDNPRYNTVH